MSAFLRITRNASLHNSSKSSSCFSGRIYFLFSLSLFFFFLGSVKESLNLNCGSYACWSLFMIYDFVALCSSSSSSGNVSFGFSWFDASASSMLISPKYLRKYCSSSERMKGSRSRKKPALILPWPRKCPKSICKNWPVSVFSMKLPGWRSLMPSTYVATHWPASERMN